jgi:hypothetical protein
MFAGAEKIDANGVQKVPPGGGSSLFSSRTVFDKIQTTLSGRDTAEYKADELG